MNIHEHQAKKIFSDYNVPVPRGHVAYTVDEAVEAAEKLGGDIFVVKAQIHAGGRGKGGGVTPPARYEDDPKLARERGDRLVISEVDLVAPTDRGIGGDPVVARRDEDIGSIGRARQLPGDGVFATSRTEHQKFA